MILTPCGHSVCQNCLNNLSKCPLCRAAIGGKSVNFSLHNLIISLQTQVESLKQQSSKVELIAQDPGSSAESILSLDLSESARTALAQRYLQQHQQLSLRCSVLESRLAEIQAERSQLLIAPTSLRLVLNHLESEREIAAEKIRNLEREIALIDSEIARHSQSLADASIRSAELESAENAAQSTFAQLQIERSKCALIVESLRADWKQHLS